ncbi:hypothetical protein [Cellulomonas humilata]|uniref:Uncharacterized protein n=1 Tax=Cellulomonas humilata TaxID=144055 RepID=A0ABU0ECJ8_9CELL|nr:hypothetical protein [Cellulomonas humilata]MDQ0372993.1 hypothetical protein [Cellulomonas humilata]
MGVTTSVSRQYERRQASRGWTALLALLTVAAAGSACTAPGTPPAADPTSTSPTEQPTSGAAPFVVQPFDGPDPAPVVDGTTHRYVNPHSGPKAAGAPPPSDYRWIEYTVPAGWEVGDTYIGKNLGEPDEVALSFWTAAGVYPDPCRRSGKLSPWDLSVHDHPDDATISLGSYPATGLATQHERDASEPRSVAIPDPTVDAGTPALRFELTVPADLDISTCDDGAYRSWPGYADGYPPNDNHVAGQTDIVYEVDVDRSPLIIDASFRPDSSAEDIAELRSVIGSIVMDRW